MLKAAHRCVNIISSQLNCCVCTTLCWHFEMDFHKANKWDEAQSRNQTACHRPRGIPVSIVIGYCELERLVSAQKRRANQKENKKPSGRESQSAMDSLMSVVLPSVVAHRKLFECDQPHKHRCIDRWGESTGNRFDNKSQGRNACDLHSLYSIL